MKKWPSSFQSTDRNAQRFDGVAYSGRKSERDTGTMGERETRDGSSAHFMQFFDANMHQRPNVIVCHDEILIFIELYCENRWKRAAKLPRKWKENDSCVRLSLSRRSNESLFISLRKLCPHRVSQLGIHCTRVFLSSLPTPERVRKQMRGTRRRRPKTKEKSQMRRSGERREKQFVLA